MQCHFFVKQLLMLSGYFMLAMPMAMAEPNPDLLYNLKGTIVKVHTVTKNGRQGTGSGVVVAKNLVATNCHVLANSVGANVTAMGETYIPLGVRADWKHDVCIMSFQFLPLKPAEFAANDALDYEADTFAVGFSGGTVKPLTTTGKIKALYALDDAFVIRTSASFQIGASGSPLFNDQGQLIGMNTFKSPGTHAYFYNVPAKWIKAAMTLPETDKVVQTDNPFWDAPLEARPYWMQVVLPMQAGRWQDVLAVANQWVKVEPNNPEAIYYYALAQQNLAHAELAKPLFLRVLKLNPRHTASMVALTKMAQAEGNPQEFAKFSEMLAALDADALTVLTSANLDVSGQSDAKSN